MTDRSKRNVERARRAVALFISFLKMIDGLSPQMKTRAGKIALWIFALFAFVAFVSFQLLGVPIP